MPFVPTPILSLYDIGHFEEEDDWDALTDTNWSRIEIAAHGVGTVSVGSIDVTLDDTAYTGTVGIRAAHVITGTQVADVAIIVPSKQRTYVFVNAATLSGGVWTVTVKTVDQIGGIVLNVGDRAVVICDGTTVTSVLSSAEFLQLAGGTMSGDINLGNVQRVTNAADGVSAKDYVTLDQLNAAVVAATDAARPIGTIIFTTNPDNPATYLGYGTWTAFATGKFIIGAGTGTDGRSETKTFTAGDSGGEYNHALTIPEMPAHTHSGAPDIPGGAGGGSAYYNRGAQTGSTGGSAVHNNIPPYIVAYIWLRTA